MVYDQAGNDDLNADDNPAFRRGCMVAMAPIARRRDESHNSDEKKHWVCRTVCPINRCAQCVDGQSRRCSLFDGESGTFSERITSAKIRLI